MNDTKWGSFLMDMTNEEYNNFLELSHTAKLKAYNHWKKTEGEHIDYTFKN